MLITYKHKVINNLLSVNKLGNGVILSNQDERTYFSSSRDLQKIKSDLCFSKSRILPTFTCLLPLLYMHFFNEKKMAPQSVRTCSVSLNTINSSPFVMLIQLCSGSNNMSRGKLKTCSTTDRVENPY